jgi:hypothetical protein
VWKTAQEARRFSVGDTVESLRRENSLARGGHPAKFPDKEQERDNPQETTREISVHETATN